MFCPNCGKQNSKNSLFCKHCGKKIPEEGDVEKEASANDSSKKKSRWNKIFTVLGILIGWLIGRALGLVFFFLIIGWIAGYWLAKWFIKNHENSTFFSVVAWFNIISWLSPIMGFLTASITYVFAQQKKQTKYNVLWVLALILAIGNALFYPLTKSINTNNNSPTTVINFKTSYKSSFVNECDKTAGDNGQQTCSCMADYMVNNYTEAELTELSLQYQNTHKLPKAFQEAASSCVGSNTNSPQ